MDESSGTAQESLSKKDRWAIRKAQKQRVHNEQARKKTVTGIVYKLAAVLLLIIAGAWIWKTMNSPLPGQAVANLGREHVPSGTAVTYNSNPPTSGSHNAQWEKAGIYDRILPDERLIHSLEHGYVVISYKCTKPQIFNFQFSIFKDAYAHETEEEHDENEATGAATVDVSGWKDDPECQNLVSQLKSVMEKSKAKRLILVPRPSLDAKIALTAWGRIDKMDEADQDRMLRFIRAYHNKGPERTME